MYGYKKLSSGLLGVLIAVVFSLALPLSVLAFESESRQFRGLPQDYTSSTYTHEKERWSGSITEKDLFAGERDSRQFLGRHQDYERGSYMHEQKMATQETGKISRQFLGLPEDYNSVE